MQPAEDESFGARWDRELMDLALSVRGAVLWSLSFDDGVTWVSPGMDALLDMSGASEREVRERVEQLVEPLVLAAGASEAWEDLEVQQPLAVMGEHTRWIGFRARRADESGLVGIAADASDPQGATRCWRTWPIATGCWSS